MPKSTPENEPLLSYASATKKNKKMKKKMEKIESQFSPKIMKIAWTIDRVLLTISTLVSESNKLYINWKLFLH